MFANSNCIPPEQKENQRVALYAFYALTLIAAFFFFIEPAIAGSINADGTPGSNPNSDFDAIWTKLKDWVDGSLGRVVCGSMVLVGIVAGIARQSIMALATGTGGGVGLYYSPLIIEKLFSATLDGLPHYAPSLIHLSNGLS